MLRLDRLAAPSRPLATHHAPISTARHDHWSSFSLSPSNVQPTTTAPSASTSNDAISPATCSSGSSIWTTPSHVSICHAAHAANLQHTWNHGSHAHLSRFTSYRLWQSEWRRAESSWIDHVETSWIHQSTGTRAARGSHGHVVLQPFVASDVFGSDIVQRRPARNDARLCRHSRLADRQLRGNDVRSPTIVRRYRYSSHDGGSASYSTSQCRAI